ncbi:MAG: ABC transporter permease subunit, partial [Lentisphaerae bacterium]|nr:ABC transporter permease subunit [Lentisphaerota bacterium]
MEYGTYFLRRLLLLIPTFIGITLVSFALCQFVPGGPVEQALLQMRGVDAADRLSPSGALSEEQRLALEKHFGFDQPLLKRYWQWLVTNKIGLAVASYKYPHKSVWQLIKERFPVSLIFGVSGFLLTYLVCVPLGIAKALRQGTAFDWISSVVVFVGYAIPAFAFGMLLKMLFCGTSEQLWNIFPVSGFVSDHFELLAPLAKIKDIAWHMALPVLCYMIGHFAVLTLLMKNSLLEQIGQDYMRLVLARGASLRRAIWAHALRNALVPIATGFGGVLTVMFAGAVLIERVFEIPGMGRLSLEAIVGRDYMVFMG